MNWDEGLIDPWKQVAGSTASPLRVVAGPGTGKTFALMRRVGRLLQEGCDPKHVFLCTFTRTSADDLARSLVALDIEGADKVRVGTVHSYCFSLLTRNEVLETTGRIPRPLFDYEERFLLEDLKGQAFGGIWDCEKRLAAFSAAWARLQSEDPGWPADPVDRAFHQALLAWLRFHEAMLIGELVPLALNYLRNNPFLNDFSFEHILVDEYQDLNRAEQELLKQLSSVASLSVVGDEDQCIYEFKHANPEGIRSFEASEDHSLDECRRCPSKVVLAANELISHNANRHDRILKCRADAPEGEMFVVQWRSMEEEAVGISKFVAARARSESTVPGKVLILAPRRQFGYAIRDALNVEGVVAQSFFQEEALEGNPKTKEEYDAQQAMTMMILLVNQNDRIALRCWCGFGSPSLRSKAWARLRNYCEANGESPSEALSHLSAREIKIPNTGELVSRYEELVAMLDDLRARSPREVLDQLFPESADWSVPLRSLVLPRLEVTPDLDLGKMLEILRAGITQPELPVEVDYVRVMSLHKSKGLTADLVVVAGCIEGAIPRIDLDLPIETQKAAEEEQRRLFYVAITRTTATLVLSSIASIPVDQSYKMGIRIQRRTYDQAFTVTSRFVGEVTDFRNLMIAGAAFLRQQDVS